MVKPFYVDVSEQISNTVSKKFGNKAILPFIIFKVQIYLRVDRKNVLILGFSLDILS